MDTVDSPPIAATRRLTADEFARLPDSNTAELIDGVATDKTSDVRSCRTEARIAYLFTRTPRAERASEVYIASLGFRVFQHAVPHDPDRIRKPDVCAIRSERLVAMADPDPDFMPIVPDLAVEVLSQFDVWAELVGRVREYHAACFPLVWVADPMFRTVTAYPLGGKPVMLAGDDTITAESALPGFACRVSDLFPPPLPQEAQ